MADNNPKLDKEAGSELLISEHEFLKKKIQQIDLRHEHIGKDLLKKLNAAERKAQMTENQYAVMNQQQLMTQDKVLELELFVNYM